MGLALVGVGFFQMGKGLGVEIYRVVRRLLFLYQFFMRRIFCWSIDARGERERERERVKRRTSLRKGKSQPSDDEALIQLYPPSIEGKHSLNPEKPSFLSVQPREQRSFLYLSHSLLRFPSKG
ncbi:hypothetical protein L1049_023958 [Liquidambar formosana]|uniref:Uncharacterized protein n=1 Tax=Liquidambar formosana TaxID=63359 RepID=A0AAP0RU83_LIQFO